MLGWSTSEPSSSRCWSRSTDDRSALEGVQRLAHESVDGVLIVLDGTGLDPPRAVRGLSDQHAHRTARTEGGRGRAPGRLPAHAHPEDRLHPALAVEDVER